LCRTVQTSAASIPGGQPPKYFQEQIPKYLRRFLEAIAEERSPKRSLTSFAVRAAGACARSPAQGGPGFRPRGHARCGHRAGRGRRPAAAPRPLRLPPQVCAQKTAPDTEQGRSPDQEEPRRDTERTPPSPLGRPVESARLQRRAADNAARKARADAAALPEVGRAKAKAREARRLVRRRRQHPGRRGPSPATFPAPASAALSLAAGARPRPTDLRRAECAPRSSEPRFFASAPKSAGRLPPGAARSTTAEAAGGAFPDLGLQCKQTWKALESIGMISDRERSLGGLCGVSKAMVRI
jgi:hypothetical protein